MPLNFGPPVIDFSPLGKLGESYDAGVKRNREAAMNDARQKALAGFGQNSDLAALGQTLLRSGDLEGGMAALRLDAANKGTPWQREQAAREDARSGASLEETRRQHDREEEYRKRTEERTTRPERVTGKDEFGDPKYGDRDPVTGAITWDDGTTTPGRGGRGTGPRSGGEDDPNLPPTNAQTAQLALSPQTSADPGYVIPKTLQGFPPGTVLPPGGLAALAPPGAATDTAIAAPAAATAAPLAPPGATGPTAVAQAPTAPPPAAAAPGQPTVPGAPVTATQISQGTANIPPMTAQEMIAEARRLGISPGQYRAARAEAIKKELEAKSGGGKALTEAQDKAQIGARRMEGAEREFRPLSDTSQSLWERGKATMPGFGPWAASDEYKGAEAAKKEWIEGFLRPVSGATILPGEYENYDKIYFPQLGDGPNIVAQKARARERALQGVKAGLPADTIAKMEQGQTPLAPAPGEAGKLESGTSLTTKSGIKATW